LSGSLSAEHLRSAYLGLGSTYRALGQYSEAERTLREGLAHFPEAAELKVFLAMAFHNIGQSKQAVELLLTVLAESSSDAQSRATARQSCSTPKTSKGRGQMRPNLSLHPKCYGWLRQHTHSGELKR
jgi:tetratricopeptide (TPR) repeat protein